MRPGTPQTFKPTAVPGVDATGGMDRLDSWKEIAAQLNRDVRTVQRWEIGRALPVHRLPGGPKAGVFAFRSELDEWLAGRVKPACAAISPDGRTLAFLATQDQEGELQVWTASPPASPPNLYQTLPLTVPLTIPGDAAGHRNNPQLAFSPDGREILLILSIETGNQYWIVPSSPDKPRRLLPVNSSESTRS